MNTLRFDGRVAVVTGAGGGLGRSYALLLASRGAKIVVNDLGVNKDGKENSSRPADTVVAEIILSGGIAVADYNSVVEGGKIIKTALDHFGRIDILINNAGILRDRSLLRISNSDWDMIQDVHLKGSFKTTQAAFDLFKKQRYGRIVMTSSTSGLYGNFGQANYSAAKMGVVGLSNTVALEGSKHNIHCNVIVPLAGTRLTQPFMDVAEYEQMNPDHVAAVVAYLCHETCKENGIIVEAGAGQAKMIKLSQNLGVNLKQKESGTVTVETVRDSWHQVANMSNAKCVELGFKPYNNKL